MNNKTYTILQSFDKYEVNRLRKFLQSPYFNMNEAIVELFEIFIKDIFAKSTKELTKEIIWSKIYGQKRYDDVRFRKLNSELLKLVEKFLAQQVYEDNPIHQANYLIEAVGNRRLEKLYNSTMRTARRLSETQKLRSASYYFYQYEIERNYYELTNFETKRDQKSNLDEITKNLDYFFLGEKLRIYCSILARQNQFSYKYEVSFMNEILKYVSNKELESIPLIEIYYQIYNINKQPENEEYYFNLKKLLNQNSLQFPFEEANSMYNHALNYCVRKINKGNNKFLREYFDLYSDLISKKFLIVDGELNPWIFKNIIATSLRLGEYPWTEDFIFRYKEKISLEFRDNAVTFNLARLNFYQKKYDEVIRLLNKVEYEDLAYNLDSKLMLLAVYYETDEIEPLYHLFESFRVYLNRKKNIPQERKRRYLNLIKFTKKLTKLMPGDKKTIEKLKTDIAETRDIVNLKWLKEKIAELE